MLKDQCPAAGIIRAGGDSTSSRFAQYKDLVSVHYLLRDGGADRDRTDDILLAKQALSQLSYSPIHTMQR